jgi:hypothetical protein
MSRTFANCTNLSKISKIPDTVINMDHTFADCDRLITAPIIPNSVINMYGTFSNSINIEGEVYIKSENVTNASSCFYNYITKPTKDKDVYIPFKYTDGTFTKTYNTFTKVGYPISGSRRNGVLLKDINQLPPEQIPE